MKHVAWISVTALIACTLLSSTTPAVETVHLNLEGHQKILTGQVVVEDSVGSMLLETDEGAMWPIMANTIQQRRSDAEPFQRLDKEAYEQRLQEELGPDFQVYQSKHYVVVFNTTRRYAQWCSSLLERLQRGFLAYWKKKGCDVHEPEHPLVVVILGDKDSYLHYAKQEMGEAAGNAIGFYSLKSNRITMYDLTGMQSLRRENSQRGSLHDITAMLAQPEAEPLVATIVHEATHQIAFNCGLQKRFGANPIWVGEGLAMFCETPELRSNRSWRGIGRVNYQRWDRYRENENAGAVAPLRVLIASDQRLRNPRTALDGYAEAWAWTYFLATWHTDQYVDYLKTLYQRPVLSIYDKRDRLRDFTTHFGDDLTKLEDDFYRRMSRVE